MPVIDGIMDVPVLEWCPAYDAALWIMLKRPPVASHHLGLVNDASLSLGFDAEGQNVRDNTNYFPSWDKLYEAAAQGKVELRGRPAIGLQKIVFELLGPSLRCEKWGDFEPILPAKLKAAGVFAFSNVERSRFLNDGMIYPTEFFPETAWAYTDIEVNFLQLMTWFHPAEGKALRVDTEVNFIEPEAPRAEASAKVVAKKEVGRRPRIWDRDGAINATRGAIYDGKLVRTPEAAAILGLSASTLEKLRLKGNGPKYAKLGRVCAYLPQDLEAWAAARSRKSTSESSGES